MTEKYQKQKQFLKKSAESGRLSHAYLFSGPERAAKKAVALEWAKSLIGQDFRAERHPDLVVVEPEKEIKIDQIRDLIWKLSLTPYSSSLKVAIIDEAHLMTKDSQDCLLKTLEEPRGNAVLILISGFPDVLPLTILSRCQEIKFYCAVGLKPEKLGQLKEEIGELAKKDLAGRFQRAKLMAEKDDLREILDMWQIFFRDLLLTKLRGKESGFSFSKLKNILFRLESVIFLIGSTNVNQRLALETLMLEL